jgi:hypothetical protein
MGHQIKKLLYNKGSNQQSKEIADTVEENICQSFIRHRTNIQNVQTKF